MNKSTQIALAFTFGVVFVVVMLVIALLVPFPSEYQYFTFRVVLSLAAGGVVAMLPGFLSFSVSTKLRSGGALAAFAMIYFANPAQIGLGAKPAGAEGVFVKEVESDGDQREYFWKQADVWFRFPRSGWRISTKAAESGLGDLTLTYDSDPDAQVQMHVSKIDDRYRNAWDEYMNRTISMYEGTISQFGEFSHREIFLDGRSAFEMNGFIRGNSHGLKKVTLLFAPLGGNRMLEVHLTRNSNSEDEQELSRAYRLITSTIKFDR